MDDLLKVSEVAKVIKTNVHFVNRLIDTGELPSLKMGCRKVRKEALEDFLRKWEGWDITDPSNPIQLKHIQ